MKDFIEKWNTDSRFKTKIKLGLYTLFVVLVAILAFSNQSSIPTNELDYEFNDNDIDTNIDDVISIKIPEKYNYINKIIINEKEYQYIGTKEPDKESIDKIIDNVTTNYIYENNNYYKNENGSYVLTTKEDIYDVVEPSYLNLETINKYLSKSIIENNQYIVYLKDIILGNDSDEYITISIDENKINIDYTSLIKLFDETIEKYLLEVIIEKE